MKQRSFYFFLILLFLGSCLAEQNNELLVPTCHDGIQNQDETEVDCGGRCIACELYVPVTAPCASALSNDTYTWNGIDDTLGADNIGCYDETDYFEIFIVKNGREIRIRFPSFPTEDKIYHASQNYYPEGDEAYILLIEGFDFRSSAGDIHVHVHDGVVTAEFCDVTMVNMYVDPRPIMGRITCK